MAERANPLTANIVFTTTASVVSNLSLVVGAWATIHFFGLTFHGGLAWIASVAHLCLLASDMGLAGKAGVRNIVQRRAAGGEIDGTVSAAAIIPLALAAVLGLAMAAFAGPISGWRPGLGVAAVRLAGAWIVLLAGIRVCRTLSIGFERMGNILLTMPVAEVGKTAWIFICVWLELPARYVFHGWTGAMLIALAVSLWRCRRLSAELGFRIRLGAVSLGQSAWASLRALPYHIPTLGLMALPFVMPVLVGAWFGGEDAKTDAAISTIRVCTMLALLPRLLALPLATALMPRFVHMDSADSDTSRMGDVLGKVTRLIGLVSSLALAMFWLVGAMLLGVLSPEYVPAAGALMLLVAAPSADKYSVQLEQVLMATGRVNAVAATEIGKYVILVVGAMILIPAWGVFGAAAAVGVAAGANAVCKVLLAWGRARAGVLSLVSMLAVFGAVSGAAVLPHGRWLVAPAWVISALVFGLLRPRELRDWTRGLIQTFRR